MNLLILWASLADYTVACFRELAKKDGVSITLVYQSSKSIAPFEGLDLSFCSTSYEVKINNWNDILFKLSQTEVDIVLMASWNYKQYMSLAKKFRAKGKPVISAFDNQWKATLKQQLARIVSPFFLKPVITNFLVPGDRQAQFASKLGYKQPLQGFYCANSKNFKTRVIRLIEKKFIYVGRLVEQKGIKKLLLAYQQYREQVAAPWPLIMVGEGPLKEMCNNSKGVELMPFTQPENLPILFSKASCFILPSIHENWGLVIHEAALAGLPIICSSACGASTWMVRDCQNGFLVPSEKNAIKKAMVKIHYKSENDLKAMSELSFQLGNTWTVEKWANHIYSEFSYYMLEDNF